MWWCLASAHMHAQSTVHVTLSLTTSKSTKPELFMQCGTTIVGAETNGELPATPNALRLSTGDVSWMAVAKTQT
jgi:hypothetical protein